MSKDKSRHTVAIVLKADFGEAVLDLARRQHVWLVESPVNTAAANSFWNSDTSTGDPLASGITTFKRPPGTVHEALAVIVESVDEHHGEYAHDPSVDRLLVYGVGLDADVQECLSEWGFSGFRAEDGHFVAQK
jgi:hypothetical protein